MKDGAATAAGCAVVFVWLISVLLSLAMTGVMIWAVIKLVSHFT